VKSVSDMPLKKLGKLDPSKRIRKVQDESIGTVGDLIRDINEQVRKFAADRLAKAREARPGARGQARREKARGQGGARQACREGRAEEARGEGCPGKGCCGEEARCQGAREEARRRGGTREEARSESAGHGGCPGKAQGSGCSASAPAVAKRPAVARKRVATPARRRGPDTSVATPARASPRRR